MSPVAPALQAVFTAEPQGMLLIESKLLFLLNSLQEPCLYAAIGMYTRNQDQVHMLKYMDQAYLQVKCIILSY